jgi:hypothetical protein
MSYELSCSSSEQTNNIYVFEIKIIYFDDTCIKQRIISKNKCGELFTANNNIKKLKISLCILNYMQFIIFKKSFNNTISNNITLYKNNIFIILNEDEDNIKITYNIITYLNK